MHRFFTPNPNVKGNVLHLAGDEWHHCQTVLRAKKGDRITLFDGKGNEYLSTISEITPKNAVLHLLQKNTSPRPPYAITLAQALPKNKVMDLIIQKATELGVTEIIPVLSERSVVQLSPAEANSRVGRWREISIEAAKQCGLNWLPAIGFPKSVKEVAEIRSNYHLCLIGSLQGDAKPLWHYLADIKAASGGILLMIGPEGDFTPAETGLARGASFDPLSLGPLVLRCETASIYAVSVLSYEACRLKAVTG